MMSIANVSEKCGLDGSLNNLRSHLQLWSKILFFNKILRSNCHKLALQAACSASSLLRKQLAEQVVGMHYRK